MLKSISAGVLILTILACSGGSQRYFAFGTGMGPVPGNHGTIFFADGERVAPSGQTLGAKKQRLLTVVFLAGDSSKSGATGMSGTSGGSVATYKLTEGSATCDITWDKKADEIDISGAKFNRNNGTLFVVVKTSAPNARTWQLAPPVSTTRDEDIISFAKKELKNVPEVQEIGSQSNP